MKKINHVVTGAALLAVVCLVAGCQSNASRRNAAKHFEAADKAVQIENRKLVLSDCIALAKQNSLKGRISCLQNKIAGESSSAKVLKTLPALDKKKNSVMCPDAAISALDFSIAFFNDKVASDRSYLKELRDQRAAQNLALDVVRAYYDLAALQGAVAIAKVRLQQAGDPEQAKADAAQYSKFQALEKTLSDYVAKKEKACVKLCDLMGVAPFAVEVEGSALFSVPGFKFDNIDYLEQAALSMRPELYGSKEINIFNVRRYGRILYPQIRNYIPYTESHIYDLNWWSFGVRAAYNLLAGGYDVSDLKAGTKCGYAQALAIVAQVRIAYSALKKAEKDCKFEDGEVEKIFAYAALQTANFRLANVLGLSTIGAKNVAMTVDENHAAIKRAAGEFEAANRAFQKMVRQASVKAGVSDLRQVEAKVVNQSLTDFGAVDFFSVYDSTPARAAQAGKGTK